MQRYTIFYQVHKGLRLLLYENALLLQQANFTDVEETNLLFENLQEGLHLIDTKTRLQEVYIVPVIEPYEPSLALALRRKRLAWFQSYRQLKELLAVYSHERSPDGLLTTGKAIAKAWTLLTADCLEEMRENEEVVQKTLCIYYNDRQLRRIRQYIVQTLSVDEVCAYGKYIMRGLTITESINWFSETQKFLDPVTFGSLYTMAEKELSPAHFRLVMDGLAEGTRLE
jgi:hypothetical protein